MSGELILPGTPAALLALLRSRISAVIGAKTLTPAAKQVMVALILEDPEYPTLPAKVPTLRLARELNLTDRAVRGAVRELRAKGWVGAESGTPLPPEAEQAFRDHTERSGPNPLADKREPPSAQDHLETLELIRDQALAQGQSSAALRAEEKIGRFCGLERLDEAPARPLTPAELKAERKDRFERLSKAMARDYANDPAFQYRLHKLCEGLVAKIEAEGVPFKFVMLRRERGTPLHTDPIALSPPGLSPPRAEAPIVGGGLGLEGAGA